MQVFAPGATVSCNGEPARVLCVSIADSLGVRYEVGYWIVGKWVTTWLPECEVEAVDGTEHVVIGFAA